MTPPLFCGTLEAMRAADKNRDAAVDRTVALLPTLADRVGCNAAIAVGLMLVYTAGRNAVRRTALVKPEVDQSSASACRAALGSLPSEGDLGPESMAAIREAMATVYESGRVRELAS